MKEVSSLQQLIKMDQLDEFTFLGENYSIGSPIVFGGQVLAQGLYAMSQSVPEERIAHSLHGYFILPGDLTKPIRYEVEFVRDGGSFSTRRVKALQDDKIIFFMGASFQKVEEGYEHQIQMPKVPQPDELYSWDDMYEQLKDHLPRAMKQFLSIERPFIFKPTVLENVLERKPREPNYSVWFKIKGETENNPLMNRAILSYVSDYNLLTTALRPHAHVADMSNTQLATIDHAMWFHQEANINEWYLYSVDSPIASNARGFVRGSIFSQDGKLVASVAQEGLLRPITK
ncbi:acyl-CoA thioesterase II [Ornithobacterium rhinotracheale]|uniref:acyl-CoA thioesterase n=1 Tax=Ornithobacterium rhinotracheale TaxID=28251 RepID=UPI00129CF7F0|nr:acyl-CoA thioesterase II [Ornithobacterium rhinotracheale]MRJ10669.1 acyl-CoA thioesterase II [Ornithobacterium rhinotracheale]